MRQAQRNAEIVQTLHDIALEAARIRHDLEHHLDFCAFQRHAARHDESDITRAQNNDFFARHIALDVDKALRRAGGVDARRTGAADADCTAAALTATHCKHNRARLNGQNAVLAVDCGDDAILRDAQHHGITLVLDTQLVDLCMEACGILRAGQLLAEDVQTEASMDALLQDTADIAVAFQNEDVVTAIFLGCNCGSKTRRAAADNDYTAFFHCRPLLYLVLPVSM